MKSFVLLATLVAVASARPEAGYSYPRPGGHSIGNSGNYYTGSTSNGFNSGSSGFTSGSIGFNSGSTGFNSGSSSFNSGSGGFNSGSSGFNSGTGGFNSGSSGFNGGGSFTSGSSQGGFTGISSGQSSYVDTNSNLGGNYNGFNSHSTGGSIGIASNSFSTGNTGFTGQGVSNIHKHIYVHVAPPEAEEFHSQSIQAGPAPQKHYKIIFIKAPSAPTPSLQQIQLAQQSQEKTLVYVLVKKPDEQSAINIQAAAALKPSKPEVYFIRYKAQKEGGAIHGGTVNTIGGNTVVGSNEQFIGGTINSGSDQFIGGNINTNIGSDISGGSHGEYHHHHHQTAPVSTGYGPPGH